MGQIGFATLGFWKKIYSSSRCHLLSTRNMREFGCNNVSVEIVELKLFIIYTPLREGINEICYINGTFHPFYREKILYGSPL